MAGVPNHHIHTYSKSVTYNDKAASASLARQKKKKEQKYGVHLRTTKSWTKPTQNLIIWVR
jgi:hypothetical protein